MEIPAWAKVVGVVVAAAVASAIATIASLPTRPESSDKVTPKDLAAIIEIINTHERQQAAQAREMTRVLRQICRNQAKSELALMSCEDQSSWPR